MKSIYSALLLTFSLLTITPAFAQTQAEADAWMAAATPGENHAWLAKMEGKWEYTQKMWADPSQPPMESKGTATKEMILGGRYLTEWMKGDIMGMPWDGISTTGYDNLKSQYFMSWIDNTSTGMMSGTGSRSGQVLTLICLYPDPLTKKDDKFRLVTTVIDDNTHRFEMYVTKNKGKETRMMDVTYNRVK